MDTIPNPLGIRRYPMPQMMISKVIVKRCDMQALNDANDILSAAHNKADKILQAAHEEAESIRATARQEAEQQLWQEVGDLLRDLRDARAQMAEQSVEVAQTILQKAWEVLCNSLDDSDQLHVTLEQAARYFVSTSPMRLRVNPASIADTQAWLENRQNQQAGLELLVLEPDVAVRRDEVRLYLDRGGVIRADFVGTLEILKAQWT